MVTRKNQLFSIVCNSMIVFFTIVALFFMFTGIKFMHGYEPVFESTALGMFRFFTVDSNCFMGIMALIFLCYEIPFFSGKKKEIPSLVYLLKFMATASVTLTFVIVFTYLGPISEYGIFSLLMNSNLFFHLLIPILSVLTLTVFEREESIPFKMTFTVLIPLVLYSIYYLGNILLHLKNGNVSATYDWYFLFQNGMISFLSVIPIMILITYFIGFILWRLHHR